MWGGHPWVLGAPLTHIPLPAEVEVGQAQEFTVESQGAGGQGKVEVKVTGPSRRPVPCSVAPAPPGGPHPVTFTPPEEGPYKVEVTYDGHPVPGSPFPVEALLPPDPSKVSGGGEVLARPARVQGRVGGVGGAGDPPQHLARACDLVSRRGEGA